jgi:hypothetical protein
MLFIPICGSAQGSYFVVFHQKKEEMRRTKNKNKNWTPKKRIFQNDTSPTSRRELGALSIFFVGERGSCSRSVETQKRKKEKEKKKKKKEKKPLNKRRKEIKGAISESDDFVVMEWRLRQIFTLPSQKRKKEKKKR